MNVMNRNSLSYRNNGDSEEVDGLLRRFFRAEMPHPWPTLKAPVSTLSFRPAQAPKTRWTSVRSRLALAASVGFLMVGSWCLSAKLPDYGAVNTDQGSSGPGSAKGYDPHRPGVVPVAPTKGVKSEGCCPSCGKDGK
jgi:hypothetical protein